VSDGAGESGVDPSSGADGVARSAVAGELAVLGPFFVVQTHPAGSPVVPPWRPMSELVEDPAALRDRVRAVRTHLAATGARPVEAVPVRVAASVTQLGLVARVVSPAIGFALAAGSVPTFALSRTRWQPVLGGAFPLSIQEPAPRGRRHEDLADARTENERTSDVPAEDDPAGLVDELAGAVLDGPVRELVEVTRRYSVSAHVLWGNVASAVNGAATVIAASRPGWARPARELVALLLARPPLRGTGGWTADGRFRRRSCCLIYQVAASPGAVCGDCVLRRD
jgi:FhuF 2Fe-2S C-terminal domain